MSESVVANTAPSLNRSILRLAIPALGALAIDPLLTLVDTAFVARLGVVPLAGLGVDTAILGFAFFGFNFLAYATTPLVAKALASGDPDQARSWVGDALLLGLVLGVVAAMALIFGAPLFVDLMGAEAEIATPAVSYLRLRALAAPAVLVVTAGHGAFRGHQDTRTPLRVALGVNGLNIALDPLLIFGFGMGLEGAAIASVVAQVLGAFWFVRLLSGRDMVRWSRSLRSSWPTLIALGRNGVLIAIRTGLLLVGFTYAAAAATRLGAAEIGAHQVVLQLWLLAAMIADSFAIAGQAMIGDAVGNRDGRRIDQVSLRLVWFGILTGVILAVAFWATGPILGHLVTDAEVTILVGAVVTVAAVMMPYSSPLFVADGIFLGLLAFGTVIISTGSGTVVAVALIWLTPLGDSLAGIWWALAAMMAVRGLVLAAGYRRAAAVAVRS